MTKAKISEYDAVAANNTDVNGVNIAEGCPPSGMNNMGREIMAALKRFQTGADGDSVTVGGSLVVSGTATTNTLTAGPVSATTLNTSGAVVFNDAGADVDFRVEGDTDANLLFVDAGNDRVGVGTATTGSKLTIDTNVASYTNGIDLVNSANWGYGNAINFKVPPNDGAAVTTVAQIRQSFDDVNKFSLIFYSYDSGLSEHARITSGGFFKASDNGTYSSVAGPFHEFRRTTGGASVVTTNTSADPYGVDITFTNASPDNNVNYFLVCSDTGANRTIIYSDGDVWTADAGTLSSDQKLKNTITDASPKLDDVMRLRVRNFYWNEDYHPEKTDKKLIGFIAQEFEEVFPGLVREGVIRGGKPIYEDQAVVDEEGNPVLDEEGNAKTEQVQVGETEKEYAKGIKEGKLIPILVKALQEAVERIETLEAKVAALENA